MCFADHLGGNFCSGFAMSISAFAVLLEAVLGFALRFFCAAALETDLVMVLASCVTRGVSQRFQEKFKRLEA